MEKYTVSKVSGESEEAQTSILGMQRSFLEETKEPKQSKRYVERKKSQAKADTGTLHRFNF